MKKKILAILLCLTMALSLLPTVAFAEGETLTIDGITYDATVEQSGEGWRWAPEEGDDGEVELTLYGYNGGPIAYEGENYLWVYVATSAQSTITVPSTSTEAGITSSEDIEIWGYGDLVINAPNVKSDGIYAADYFDINSFYGKLEINAGHNGITANEIELDGDTNGDITIDAGSNGLSAGSEGCWIYTTGNLDITAGAVGIYSDGNVFFEPCGGAVTVNAGDDGVVSDDGYVAVYESEATIKVTADGDGIVADDGVEFYYATNDITIDARGNGIVAKGTDGYYYCNGDWNEPAQGYGVCIYGAYGDTNIYAGKDGVVAKTGSVYLDYNCKPMWIVAENGNGVVAEDTTNGYVFVCPYADMNIIAGDDGIVAKGKYVLDEYTWSAYLETCGGELGIDADGYGVWAADNVWADGYNGKMFINAATEDGIYSKGGSVYTDNAADLHVTSEDGNAIGLNTTGESFRVDTYEEIGLRFATGEHAVWNYGALDSPVVYDEEGYYSVADHPEGESYVEYKSKAPRSLTINDDTYAYSNLTSDQFGAGWSWDAEDGVLTLDGYNGGKIEAYGDLEIVLAAGSDNTVSHSNNDYGIVTCYGDLTLSGSGDLTVALSGDEYYSRYAIYGYYGDVTIDMGGDLTVEDAYYGIYAYCGGVSVTGDGDIDVTVDSYGYGIFAYGAIELTGGGKVKVAKAREGIYSYTSIDLNMSDDLTVNAYYCLDSCGDLTILSSGDIELTAAEGGYGIYRWAKGDVYFGGSGEVKIDATDGSNGIYYCESVGEITVSGTGKVTVMNGSGYALHGDEGFTNVAVYEGGELELISDSGYGIYFEESNGSVWVDEGGTLTIDSGDDGIYSDYGNIAIDNDGTLNIASDDDAVYACGNLLLDNDGTIDVSSSAYGFGASGTVKVLGTAPIEIGVGSYGLYSEYSDIVLAGTGAVTIEADEYPVYLDDDYEVGTALLLEGKNTPITLTAESGAAVHRDSDGASPVGGSAFANYKVTGAPDASSVTYTIGSNNKIATLIKLVLRTAGIAAGATAAAATVAVAAAVVHTAAEIIPIVNEGANLLATGLVLGVVRLLMYGIE